MISVCSVWSFLVPYKVFLRGFVSASYCCTSFLTHTFALLKPENLPLNSGNTLDANALQYYCNIIELFNYSIVLLLLRWITRSLHHCFTKLLYCIAVLIHPYLLYCGLAAFPHCPLYTLYDSVNAFIHFANINCTLLSCVLYLCKLSTV